MDEHTEKSASPSHDPGSGKGEEMGGGDAEPGREDTGTAGAGRPTGTGTGRLSTGINPEDEDSIDPEMPNMPPA